MKLEKYSGIIGIIFILLISYLFSNNKKEINKKLVITGLCLQVLTGYFILKIRVGQILFKKIAHIISSLLDISQEGGRFIFGFLMDDNLIKSRLATENSYIFFVHIVPAVIFICALVSMLYYFGILQIIIRIFAFIFNKLLKVSGAEALANTAVAFVGQVESAIIIQPFLKNLTKSEILTIMSGGMACISGSLMAIYSSFGIRAEYLLAASCMAIPGCFVISKIFYPETETPLTAKSLEVIEIKKSKNFIEAILDGAFGGAKICTGIIAMLIAFISLIALIDKILLTLFHGMTLKTILGFVFYPIIYLIGVPKEDVMIVSQLFGTKIALNEFIAYLDLSKLIISSEISHKSIAISSFLLCGFANLGSIAIQIGGLSQMAPERKSDFAELGFKSMICGALVSCVSASIVGMIL